MGLFSLFNSTTGLEVRFKPLIEDIKANSETAREDKIDNHNFVIQARAHSVVTKHYIYENESVFVFEVEAFNTYKRYKTQFSYSRKLPIQGVISYYLKDLKDWYSTLTWAT